MARADSSIRVNIIGDAKSFRNAADDAEKSSGKIGTAAKKAGAILAGAFAVDAVLDFSQTALGEADRIGDATARLEAQLGALSQPLIDAAGGMEKLGASRQDVLELEARFVDLGTAAGLSADELAKAASPATEAANALALLGLGGGDAATVLDLIGKAAGGSDKPLKELGISLSDTEVEARALADTGKDNADALTDGELAAARLALIMEKLQPRIQAVTDGEADLEQKQKELGARFETFTGKVGEALEGPLTDLLGWLIATGEEAGNAATALRSVDAVFDSIGGSAQENIDKIRDFLNVLRQVAGFLPGGAALNLGSTVVGTGGTRGQSSGGSVQVNVQGGSPEVVEQSVLEAIRRAQLKGLI